MSKPTYWLNLFSFKTWEEFLRAGGKVTGFRENRWKTAQRIKSGDILLCYMTGISRWIGLLRVTGKPFQDTSPIWEDADFPVRIPVEIIHKLEPETAVPITSLRNDLSIFSDLTNPNAWTGRLRGSPAKWDDRDGTIIASAVESAVRNPERRAFDQAKIKRRSPFVRKTPPSAEDRLEVVETQPDIEIPEHEQPSKLETTAHVEIQWILSKLGNDMGLDVWVARNDRNRSYDGKKFVDLPRLITELPVQFDPDTKRTVELIDVLWLQGQAILAAFEIESTTSIYSGLLRMSDLISMQPNLTMPLYIVAPDDRRGKVMTEISRPTFSRLPVPLFDVCQYVPFSALRELAKSAEPFIRHLNPQFLDEIAEAYEMEDS